jgi:ribosomal-protein-alanine N-acetyltransferase
MRANPSHPAASGHSMIRLFGRRIMLRPLVAADYAAWAEVRLRCEQWLTVWEPKRLVGQPDPVHDRDAFVMRCNARDRERLLGAGYGFGIFIDGTFAGEINMNSIQRGPFQNAYVGYWIDQARAGHSYMSEACVVIFRYAFEELLLHRLQISIIPRNANSHRVVNKLDLRSEGVAERYLEINGVWEDHVRYAITSEDWERRRDELSAAWL